jgi:iron complex outermembrane receptor protein
MSAFGTSVWVSLVILAAGARTARAHELQAPLDLTRLSLEELVDLEVTLVSRTPERLSDAAAAVFVLSEEDIRRSGATSLPEVLRLVPGLQAARFDANKWALGARGFGDLFANKLQVLIDGRSVYNPMFSGAFWESQDVLLEDVVRIEVIRGPGATLWGSDTARICYCECGTWMPNG